MINIFKMTSFPGRNFFFHHPPQEFSDRKAGGASSNIANRYVRQQSGPRILSGGAKTKSSTLILACILSVSTEHTTGFIENQQKLSVLNFSEHRWFSLGWGGRAAWILRFPEIPFVLILAVQNYFFSIVPNIIQQNELFYTTLAVKRIISTDEVLAKICLHR